MTADLLPHKTFFVIPLQSFLRHSPFVYEMTFLRYSPCKEYKFWYFQMNDMEMSPAARGLNARFEGTVET
jgi:hypothetical protein